MWTVRRSNCRGQGEVGGSGERRPLGTAIAVKGEAE